MKRMILLLGAVAVGATLLAVAATGGENSPPPPPRHAPAQQGGETFGVDGPDGKPIICANGKELRVPKGLVERPPLPPNAQGRSQGEYGWRCGTGAAPERNPRLVPLP